MWKVVFETEFEHWVNGLSEAERESVAAAVSLLAQFGPQLSRPYADSIQGSRLSNLKELRIQHAGDPYRAFFVFDPLRRAIVLCAGNKTGDKRFYQRMVPLAESIYERYLRHLEQEST